MYSNYSDPNFHLWINIQINLLNDEIDNNKSLSINDKKKYKDRFKSKCIEYLNYIDDHPEEESSVKQSIIKYKLDLLHLI